MGGDKFEWALAKVPQGYSEGAFMGRRYGATVRRSRDGGRTSPFARELADKDIVSFNLYRTGTCKVALKSCEMSCERSLTL
jgi:hypothetical protein